MQIGKVVLKDVMDGVGALVEISNLTLDPKVSYYFACLNKNLRPALREYHRELDIIFNQYAEPDLKTGELTIKSPEKMASFNKEKDNYQEAIFVDIPMEKIGQEKLSGIPQKCFNSLLWLIE